MHFLDSLDNIISQKENILHAIDNNQTTIIKGPTGCGKSTYIPYILSNSRVLLIEPRRIAVKSLFNNLKSKIKNLSYKMRFDSFTCSEIKKLQKKCFCKNNESRM
ncbi:Helicase associated domain (HA2) Add an annotation [Gurleya vavrai]